MYVKYYLCKRTSSNIEERLIEDSKKDNHTLLTESSLRRIFKIQKIMSILNISRFEDLVIQKYQIIIILYIRQ